MLGVGFAFLVAADAASVPASHWWKTFLGFPRVLGPAAPDRGADPGAGRRCGLGQDREPHSDEPGARLPARADQRALGSARRRTRRTRRCFPSFKSRRALKTHRSRPQIRQTSSRVGSLRHPLVRHGQGSGRAWHGERTRHGSRNGSDGARGVASCHRRAESDRRQAWSGMAGGPADRACAGREAGYTRDRWSSNCQACVRSGPRERSARRPPATHGSARCARHASPALTHPASHPGLLDHPHGRAGAAAARRPGPRAERARGRSAARVVRNRVVAE